MGDLDHELDRVLHKARKALADIRQARMEYLALEDACTRLSWELASASDEALREKHTKWVGAALALEAEKIASAS